MYIVKINSLKDVGYYKLQNTKIILNYKNMPLIQLCILDIFLRKLENNNYYFELEILDEGIISNLLYSEKFNPWISKFLKKITKMPINKIDILNIKSIIDGFNSGFGSYKNISIKLEIKIENYVFFLFKNKLIKMGLTKNYYNILKIIEKDTNIHKIFYLLKF